MSVIVSEVRRVFGENGIVTYRGIVGPPCFYDVFNLSLRDVKVFCCSFSRSVGAASNLRTSHRLKHSDFGTASYRFFCGKCTFILNGSAIN